MRNNTDFAHIPPFTSDRALERVYETYRYLEFVGATVSPKQEPEIIIRAVEILRGKTREKQS